MAWRKECGLVKIGRQFFEYSQKIIIGQFSTAVYDLLKFILSLSEDGNDGQGCAFCFCLPAERTALWETQNDRKSVVYDRVKYSYHRGINSLMVAQKAGD